MLNDYLVFAKYTQTEQNETYLNQKFNELQTLDCDERHSDPDGCSFFDSLKYFE